MEASPYACNVILYQTVYVSTITLLLKVIIRLHVSAIDQSSKTNFVNLSQDAMHTSGYHRVYIHGIHQIRSFVSKGVTCKLCLQQWDTKTLGHLSRKMCYTNCFQKVNQSQLPCILVPLLLPSARLLTRHWSFQWSVDVMLIDSSSIPFSLYTRSSFSLPKEHVGQYLTSVW